MRMAAAYVPAFDPRLGVPFEGDGAPLFHHAALLDGIAETLGVPLLTDFADAREPPPDFDGYPEDLAEALGPWLSWFSPFEGLRCVDSLLEVLEDDAAVRSTIPSIGAVLEDLDALHDVLLIASKRRARFRLEVA